MPSVNVRAALASVETGAADAAIVYRTDILVARRATVAWIVPLGDGPRILYPAAIVRATRVPDAARRFLNFLRGAVAARIFRQFGFQPVASVAGR